MKSTFLDNTGLQRLLLFLDKKRQAVSPSDVLAVLHFAENLMFSEGMLVSTFEIPEIRENTAKTLQLLHDLDCISSSDGRNLLQTQHFTDQEYSEVCIRAASKIQEDLTVLDPRTLEEIAGRVGGGIQPLGISKSPIERWLQSDFRPSELAEIRATSLGRKARGAYDFTLASCEALRKQLCIVTSGLRASSRLSQVALFLGVFFRVAINEELAAAKKATYTPAPGRARAICKTDQLFRLAVERKISERVVEINGHFPSALLEHIRQTEELPLPLLAIHFLRKKSPRGAAEILRAAHDLRDTDDEVASIRKWLSRWEVSYSSTDMSQREKARRELDKIIQSLGLVDSRIPWWSVLRGELTPAPDGSIKISGSLKDLDHVLAKLIQKFSRRRIFLATLARELAQDRDIGASLLAMIARPLSGNTIP